MINILCLYVVDYNFYSGAIGISKMMMVNHSLQKLDVGYNDIGDDGISAIAGALGDCKITVLNAVKCGIALVGARSLSTALSSDHTIEVLWLHDNPLTVEGALLIESACANTNCQYVGINSEYKKNRGTSVKDNLKQVEVAV